MPRTEADAVVEDHSARLRDIEGHYTEVASQLATQSVQIDQLSKDIKIGVGSLSQKMDDLTGPLKIVSDSVDEHRDQLKKLQDAEDARTKAKSERSRAVKKWAFAVIVAGAGFFGEKGASWLWDHVLSHLVH